MISSARKVVPFSPPFPSCLIILPLINNLLLEEEVIEQLSARKTAALPCIAALASKPDVVKYVSPDFFRRCSILFSLYIY